MATTSRASSGGVCQSPRSTRDRILSRTRAKAPLDSRWPRGGGWKKGRRSDAMASTGLRPSVSRSRLARRSPAAGLALVLLLQPVAERLEVLEQRSRIHGAGAGEELERVRPGPALAQRQHRLELFARLLASEDGAVGQDALVSRGLAHRLVELELEDVREEVAQVGHVGGDVILGARIEVLLRTRHRRRDPLVPLPQLPPALVVALGRDLAGEDVPPPLVDELAEGQEGDLLQGHLHLEVDQALVVLGQVIDQPDLLEITRGDREGDGVAHCLVETVMRASLEEDGEVVVLLVIEIVTELVVDRDQILLGRPDAHLDADVTLAGEIPCAGVADHVAIARLGEHGARPEGRRERIEAEREEEWLAELRHPQRVVALPDEGRVDVQVALAGKRLEQRIEVGPVL